MEYRYDLNDLDQMRRTGALGGDELRKLLDYVEELVEEVHDLSVGRPLGTGKELDKAEATLDQIKAILDYDSALTGTAINRALSSLSDTLGRIRDNMEGALDV